MDGVVLAIAFNREEYRKLREMRDMEGIKYLSELVRVRLGFEEKYKLAGNPFGHRKVSLAVASVAIRALQMNRNGIVNPVLNTGSRQRLGQSIPL